LSPVPPGIGVIDIAQLVQCPRDLRRTPLKPLRALIHFVEPFNDLLSESRKDLKTFHEVVQNLVHVDSQVAVNQNIAKSPQSLDLVIKFMGYHALIMQRLKAILVRRGIETKMTLQDMVSNIENH
jgi:hypothetical protein